RVAPPGGVLSRDHIYGYGRSLRPALATPVTPQKRETITGRDTDALAPPHRLPALRRRLHDELREALLERRREDRPFGGLVDSLRRRLPVSQTRPPRHLAATHFRDRDRILRGLPARLSDRLLQPRDDASADAVREGDRQVRPSLRVPRRSDRLPRALERARLLADAGLVLPWRRDECRLRRPPAPRRAGGAQPRRRPGRADHRPLEPDQHLRRRGRLERLPDRRPDARPEPP